MAQTIKLKSVATGWEKLIQAAIAQDSRWLAKPGSACHDDGLSKEEHQKSSSNLEKYMISAKGEKTTAFMLSICMCLACKDLQPSHQCSLPALWSARSSRRQVLPSAHEQPSRPTL